MHSLLLQIPAEKFEELNRRATEANFRSIEAYLLHLATGGVPVEPPSSPPKIRTKSVIDSGAKGA